MILPQAPDRYDPDYMSRLLRAMELAVTTLEQTTLKADGQHTTLASTATTAGFNVPHGVAPTTPINGDLWTTSAGGLFVRINGVTVGPLT